MKITYSTITLGEDAAMKPVSDYEADFRALSSVADGIAARRQMGFFRQNRARPFRFKVQRVGSNVRAALRLLHDHPELLPGRALLVIEHDGLVYHGENAVLVGCKPTYLGGIRVEFAYEFHVERLKFVEDTGDEGDVLRDVVFEDDEVPTGIVTGGAPGLIDESAMDTISDE